MRAETAHRWTLPKRFSKAARFLATSEFTMGVLP